MLDGKMGTDIRMEDYYHPLPSPKMYWSSCEMCTGRRPVEPSFET